MSLAVCAAAFALILPAELPDKTAVASLVLSTRHRALPVFAGAAAAFAVQVGIAVIAGNALALLPRRPLDLITAALFVLGAVLVLRLGWRSAAMMADDAPPAPPPPAMMAQDAPPASVPPATTPPAPTANASRAAVTTAAGATAPWFWRPAVASFAVVAIAEFGDLTQILIANLAARYHDPLSVSIGSVVALWTVAALATLSGRGLLRFVPLRLVTLLAAVAMTAMAVLSIVSAAEAQ